MKFSVITLFPDFLRSFQQMGVVGQALHKRKVELALYNPRDWTQDIHKTVDDRPFGGGDGMVLMTEPLSQCLDAVLKEDSPPPRRIYLSPQGKTLTHNLVVELAQESHLLMLCGRYAGVDQRLLNEYDFEEISVGDYVLSGGELAASIVIDAVSRQLKGVLGHESSSEEDSFAKEGLLEAPCYTRPRQWREQEVPSLFLTGNHAQIAEDRWILSVFVTFLKRPDLLSSYLKNQKTKQKVWVRAFSKLAHLDNNELTSLGLDRIDLEAFGAHLKQNKII